MRVANQPWISTRRLSLKHSARAVAQMTDMVNDRVQKARVKPSTLVN